MVKVGGKQIIFSDTIFAPEGQEIWIETVDLEGDPIKLLFEFKSDKGESGKEVKSGVTINSENDYGKVNLINWDSPLGIVTEAMLIATDEEESVGVWLILNSAKIGNIRKLSMQLMVGGVK